MRTMPFPRSRALSFCLLLLLLLPAGARGQESVSLEALLSSPFPTDLVAAPVGDAVAWIENEQGRRNVWMAEGPGWAGRQVTAYDRDDGQELTNLQWTPDGSALVYVRGGAPNRFGDVPNPLGETQGVERAIWMVARTGGEPRSLGEGSAPAVSPAGDRVAFLRGGQIWTVGLEEGAEAARLFLVRRGAGAPVWSPDGSRIAFVANRGDHSFIGVYDVSGDALRYLDPSVDRDGSPVWSPDGRRIAFLRTPNVAGSLPFFPRREGHPWSIRVADVESGSGRQVWRADPGPGSVFQGISAESQIFWAAGDRIVFPWEKTGWLNLYSVPVSGGAPTALTPGSHEVQFAALTPDRSRIVYDSNLEDIDRKHLWRVPVAGGAATRITDGAGIEWAPVTTAAGGAVAFLASGPREPAHPRVRTAAGEIRDLTSRPHGDVPVDRLVVPEQVIFPAADGMMIHGQLFLPPGLRSGERRPAVVFFHGGSRRQMLLGWHHRGYYHNAYALNQYLASRGYVVLSANYRSGIGYGMEFREAEGYGASGGSEYNDVLGAGLYLRGRSDVDPGRIGLWGGSYGGYLTAMGLSRASELFAAGVDFHGVHDWNTGIRNFVSSYEPEHHPDIARVAFESSPMSSVDTWRSPVLLIHGDDDRNVNIAETVELVEKLRDRGVEFEQLVFPDEVHGFLLHRSWLAAYRATADFLDRKLRGPERGTAGR